MSQNYEDTRTYQIGKTGEQIVLELLRSFKKVVRVDDVSDLTQYQVQDVDFVVYMNNHGIFYSGCVLFWNTVSEG